MRAYELEEDKDTLDLPDINVGDEIKVGRFKNRKATIKGFKKDKHNHPILKTTKGDQQLFKPRISKLLPNKKIVEAATKPYKLQKLSFEFNDLQPVLSSKAVEAHYDVLTRNYFKKANQTGDAFQVAGALLHQTFWEGLKSPADGGPTGPVKVWLDDEFGSFSKFKKEFKEQATTIQGNGWCALMKSGKIKQIPNHKNFAGIVLLLDMWEHAYFLDYLTDKDAYVDSFWRIVNWDIVEKRL